MNRGNSKALNGSTSFIFISRLNSLKKKEAKRLPAEIIFDKNSWKLGAKALKFRPENPVYKRRNDPFHLQ